MAAPTPGRKSNSMTDSGAAALKELDNQTHGSRPAGAVAGLIGSARRTRSLLPRGAFGAPRPIARQGGGCPRLGLTPNRAERLARLRGVRRTLRTVAGNHRELPCTVGILRRSSSAAIAANVSSSDRSEATTSLQQLGQADLELPSAHGHDERPRREAAAIIRRIVEALPLPGRVEAYLCGYADGLEAKR